MKFGHLVRELTWGDAYSTRYFPSCRKEYRLEVNGFDVLAAVDIMNAVFWDLTPRSLVGG
jgi:hypothetical protein